MEWEHFCQFDYFEWMRSAPHVALRGDNHELRSPSFEFRFKGMYSQLMHCSCRETHLHRDQLWQLFLTQALLFGVGSSMLYYPMTCLTPPFFDKHRGFAMGVAMSGSGAGGLVFAPVTQALFDRFGPSTTLRILGVWNFVILIPIAFIVRRPPGYSPLRPSLALAKRGTFILQVRTATRVRL